MAWSSRIISTSSLTIFTVMPDKLLVVEPFRLEGSKRKSLESTGRTFIAVDTLGAGENDFVLITQGSSARLTPETQELPIDAVIIGIVDTVHIEKTNVYARN